MMFIRSLADVNRAPWAVLQVTVGAITVTAQAHSSLHDTTSPQRSGDF